MTIPNRTSHRILVYGAVASILLVVILAYALIRGGPGHDEILDRQQMVEQQLETLTCLLLIPIDERSPERAAACTVNPGDEMPAD